MNAVLRPWRVAVLNYSRMVGIILGLGVVAFAVAVVLQGMSAIANQKDRGRAHAQGIIAKVRACHRTPPHPSWNECERRVEDAE